MNEVEYRAQVEGVEVRSGGDGRTVDLFLVPYAKPTRINASLTEQFGPGSFDEQVRSMGRVPLAWGHLPHGGVTVGRMTELRSAAGGLVGTGRVSKTSAGDDLLALLTDGAIPSSVSIGFRSVEDRKIAGGVTERVKSVLTEVAFVQAPAYVEAEMVGLRAEEAVRHNALKAAALRRGLPSRLA